MKSKAKAFLILIFTAFTCSFVACSKETPPEVNARIFLELLAENNIEEAKRYCLPESRMMLDMVQSMRRGFGVEDELDEYKDILIEEINCEIKENFAECTYCCNAGEEAKLIMRKHNDQWMAYLPKEG